MIYGFAITAIWLLGLVSIIYCNLEAALELDLNEWGDFLAGAFAPLAFFWLVLGYFQQGKELKLNTLALIQQERALMLQVAELKDSVQQQRALAEAAREDIEINKEAMNRQYSREKSAAQPIAEVKVSGRSSSQGVSTYGFQVYNVGGAVSHVAVTVPDVNFNIKGVLRISGSRWSNDNYLALTIVIPDNAIHHANDHFFVKVNYVDGLGEKESLSIFFTWDESKALRYRE